MKKLYGAKVHGIIDYSFAAVQALLPLALSLNRKTTRRSQVMALGVLVHNSLTKSPVGIKPLIPFKTHQIGDYSALAVLALSTLAKDVRKEKKALGFTLGLLALGITNVLLTDWNREDN